MSHINLIARKLFKGIAQQQWHLLGKRHKLGLDRSEIGTTDDIIYEMVRFVKHHPGAGIEVWKSQNESRNGHDIDLFVRDHKSSGFYWFPLQAKVLDHQQQYAHIAPGGKKAQWPLLQRLQRNAAASGFFCQPYYLWYTGFTPRTTTTYLERWNNQVATELATDLNLTIDDITPMWRAAFGCSLTPPDVVQTVCAAHPKPWYHHFHNRERVKLNQTIAWHHLFDNQFIRNLTNASSAQPFSDSDVQSRKHFYKHTVTPFAPKKEDPINYYYYGGEALTAGDEPELLGRYMVVIDRPRLADNILAALGPE